ncbi:hypothetical protein HMPREF1624_08213 [Sporothrix schenckii ATCC 58251]|uniref:AMP-dependent synthetase/ligase domain-containing protein n=1 Tax=Sporothrix schenckii (strain ATCC 58251 / de Perez 2211183) TaxID=1391915 RepID=U7PLC4_SPOS1|nr:hypothetical protein HMPREF1624_08213 [Sporothrix schenckii ATCC 58251]
MVPPPPPKQHHSDDILSKGSPKQRLSIISGPSEPALLRCTFNDILRERVRLQPNNVVVASQHQNNTRLTYGELHRQSTQLAVALYEQIGVRRGDRVAVLLGNCYEYAVIMLACSRLGAYFTLFNYAYTRAELMHALQSATPRVLFTTAQTPRYDYRPILKELQIDADGTGLRHVVMLDEEYVTTSTTDGPVGHNPLTLQLWAYEDLMRQGAVVSLDTQNEVAALEGQVTDADILNLQFTSGSTGQPKTVALTQHGMVNSARYIALLMQIQPTDAINVPVPLFHAFGLVIGFCAALLAGASIVLPSEYFDAAATLQAVERFGCTGLYGVTTMFVDMLSDARFTSTKRSSLRFGVMAGSAMPKGLLTRVITKFPIRDIYTNWGMTELSSIATMTVAGDSEAKKLNSAGRLLPNFSARIVDPDTAETLPWGQRGEIVVSGFGVMHSYYGQPAWTAQAIRSRGGRGRWMHTGDEGYLDADGYFVITGRIKDLIIRGGENISPTEIEARLFQHPAIKQCSVFGVPSARYGEEVAAILERDEQYDGRPSDTEVRAWVRQTLSRYKAPIYIWWLGEADGDPRVPADWPKTANGKLKKGDIRKIGEGTNSAITMNTKSNGRVEHE